MSSSLVPSNGNNSAALNSCGCCDGVDVTTPQSIVNRPGLDELRYRIGTHQTFFQSMIARLTQLCEGSVKDCSKGGGTRPLKDKLTTRNPSDPAIAILDGWSLVADVLTFYQERIANEAYLRTANERRSLYEISRLVGYQPRPGVSASVYLAFEVEAPPTVNTVSFNPTTAQKSVANLPVLIPKRTQAKSTPRPGTEEQPQTFETDVDFTAYPQWNRIAVRQTRPQDLSEGKARTTSKLYFSKVGLNLRPGDPLLIEYSQRRSDRPRFVRVKDVQEDRENAQTTVTLQGRTLTAEAYADAIASAFSRTDAHSQTLLAEWNQVVTKLVNDGEFSLIALDNAIWKFLTDKHPLPPEETAALNALSAKLTLQTTKLHNTLHDALMEYFKSAAMWPPLRILLQRELALKEISDFAFVDPPSLQQLLKAQMYLRLHVPFAADWGNDSKAILADPVALTLDPATAPGSLPQVFPNVVALPDDSFTSLQIRVIKSEPGFGTELTLSFTTTKSTAAGNLVVEKSLSATEGKKFSLSATELGDSPADSLRNMTIACTALPTSAVFKLVVLELKLFHADNSTSTTLRRLNVGASGFLDAQLPTQERIYLDGTATTGTLHPMRLFDLPDQLIDCDSQLRTTIAAAPSDYFIEAEIRGPALSKYSLKLKSTAAKFVGTPSSPASSLTLTPDLGSPPTIDDWKKALADLEIEYQVVSAEPTKNNDLVFSLTVKKSSDNKAHASLSRRLDFVPQLSKPESRLSREIAKSTELAAWLFAGGVDADAVKLALKQQIFSTDDAVRSAWAGVNRSELIDLRTISVKGFNDNSRNGEALATQIVDLKSKLFSANQNGTSRFEQHLADGFRIVGDATKPNLSPTNRDRFVEYVSELENDVRQGSGPTDSIILNLLRDSDAAIPAPTISSDVITVAQSIQLAIANAANTIADDISQGVSPDTLDTAMKKILAQRSEVANTIQKTLYEISSSAVVKQLNTFQSHLEKITGALEVIRAAHPDLEGECTTSKSSVEEVKTDRLDPATNALSAIGKTPPESPGPFPSGVPHVATSDEGFKLEVGDGLLALKDAVLDGLLTTSKTAMPETATAYGLATVISHCFAEYKACDGLKTNDTPDDKETRRKLLGEPETRDGRNLRHASGVGGFLSFLIDEMKNVSESELRNMTTIGGAFQDSQAALESLLTAFSQSDSRSSPSRETGVRAFREFLLTSTSGNATLQQRLLSLASDPRSSEADLIYQIAGSLEPELRTQFYELLRLFRVETRQRVPRVFVLRSRATLFGLRSPGKLVELKTAPPDPLESLGNDLYRVQYDTTLAGTNAPDGPNNLWLDGDQFRIQPGDYVKLVCSEEPTDATAIRNENVLRVASVVVGPRADFGLTGNTTHLKLEDNEKWIESPAVTPPAATPPADTTPRVTRPILKDLQTTLILCDQEELPLGEEEIPQSVGNAQLELDGITEGLHIGKRIIIEGRQILRRQGNLASAVTTQLLVRETATIVDIENKIEPDLHGDRYCTRITLDRPLSYQYERSSCGVYANVVDASHGASLQDTFDTSVTDPLLNEFQTKRGEVTYRPNVSVSGIGPAIDVYVNSVLQKRDDGQIRADQSGSLHVKLVDNDSGPERFTGKLNLRFDYRSGIGVQGNVAGSAIGQLQGAPLGVKGVQNPLSAEGGAAPDGVDAIRRRTPLGAVASDRIVSVSDYEAFAANFAGVSKAVAHVLDGKVIVSFAGPTEARLGADNPIFRNLQRSLTEFGDPYQSFVLVERTAKLLIIVARIAIDTGLDWPTVAAAVRLRLIDVFGLSRSSFGRNIYRGDVVATIQSVPGVAYVDLDTFSAVSEDDRNSLGDALRKAYSGNSDQVLSDSIESAGARRIQGDAEFLGAELCYLTDTVKDTLILNQIEEPRR